MVELLSPLFQGQRECGNPTDGKFIAFWLSRGVVVAGMNANVWDVKDDIQRLVRERVVVHPDRLADPETPLDTLT